MPILHDLRYGRNRRRCYQSSQLVIGPNRWTQFQRCKEIVRRNQGKKRSHRDSVRCASLDVDRTTLRECWPVWSYVVDVVAAAFGDVDAADGVDYVDGILNDYYLNEFLNYFVNLSNQLGTRVLRI